MNISTGGPHILFFERDQQLAVLLTSEFQLAGYECHTARTAVEVFDAIARHPVKIVLVNVAQAAAARREFWVALDSQRRGRGVQVLTFRCTNIAGYGPHDAEDHSQQAMVDAEIDGMLGVMNLVDTVRARIPGPGLKANTGTMPRIPRMTTPPPPIQQTPSAISRAASQQSPPASPMLNSLFTNNAPARPSINDSMQTPPRPLSPVQPFTSTPAASTGQAPLADIPSETSSSSTSTYTDKIRAVLYPNQRVWTPQGTNNAPAVPENKSTYDPSATTIASSPLTSAPTEATTLQRLASGQIGTEGPEESGLARLSRMLQERQSPQQNPDYFARNNYSYQPPEPQRTEEPSFPIPNNAPGSSPTSPMNYAAPVRPAPTAPENAAPVNYATPPATRPAQAPEQTTISAQPLRASPIQDIPAERPINGQPGVESVRRPESLARPAYGSAPQQPAAMQPLASIATPPASQPAPVSQSAPAQVAPQPASYPEKAAPKPPVSAVEEKAEEYITEEPEEQTLHQISGELVSNEKVKSDQAITTTPSEEVSALLDSAMAEQEGQIDLGTSPNSAMLLDIMQSLPPMPPTSPQTSQVQPQVLNGRATRTLGSVLLEGHLVPQNRLEVAQRIQRMLRGVDLNYQLGEILLMFKLLTPDQLLAASLVSYGMITTAQISSLGRIRQELHAIGLEYDLENLLILFRILTPEQLREVRSSWQG